MKALAPVPQHPYAGLRGGTHQPALGGKAHYRPKHLQHLVRCGRTTMFSNVVPSARAILEMVLAILLQVRGATYTDSEIVERGTKFNTLQWQIDTVRDRIGDTNPGQLTGLFSSAQMLTSRFRSWRKFDANNLTDALMKSARTNPVFLSSEADHRILWHMSPVRHVGSRLVRSAEPRPRRDCSAEKGRGKLP